MARTLVYARDLADPWASSILEGKRALEGAGEESLFLILETDEAGREISWKLLERDGSVKSSRLWEYDEAGRPLSLKEFFSETESEVLHRWERSEEGGMVHETERVEYSGELGSIFEREFGSDGALFAERELDASGEPVDVPAPSGEDAEEAEDAEAEAAEEDSGQRDVEEKDERGRVVKRISSVERNGAVFVQTTSLGYQGESDKPSLMRVDRVAILDPEAPPRPLSSGFRQVRYDDSGRVSELLLVSLSEADFEADRLYRFEYS